MIAITIAITILHILEPGVATISGEGNRFAHYLTIPYRLKHILRARLASVLIPLLLEAMGISIFLSWQLQIGLVDAGIALLIALVVIAGATSILVMGSSWDLDMNEGVEGGMQALIMEEAPLTPRRMILALASLLSATGMIGLVYCLPVALALPCVTIAAGSLTLFTEHLSLGSLTLNSNPAD